VLDNTPENRPDPLPDIKLLFFSLSSALSVRGAFSAPSCPRRFLPGEREKSLLPCKVAAQMNLAKETVWLTQAQMQALFDKNKRTISEHISNIFKEGELKRSGTVRKFRTVRQEDRVQSTIKGEGACLQRSSRGSFGKRYRLVEP